MIDGVRARIFWIDAIAALLAGIVVLALRAWLAEQYRLPIVVVTAMGAINLAYAGLGLTIAPFTPTPWARVSLLVAANSAWVAICVALAAAFVNRASVFGVAHLLLEGAFVAALTLVERDALQRSRR